MKYYVTTPIYYVNNIATVGTAYTSIACDTVARYHRMRGDDVLFTTGTDEHAVRVLRLAEEKGRGPAGLGRADRRAVQGRLGAGSTSPTTTSSAPASPRQHRAVQAFFQKLYENGDLYLGSYEGWYCVPDETFFTEEDLKDGCCPNPECGKPVEWVSEPAYFFRLSKYQEPLLQYIEDHPGWLLPEFRKNEVVSFIQGGLRDVCVTPPLDLGHSAAAPSIPNSEGLVVYVWADALVNYLTCAGYPDDQAKFEKYWPADVHLMAKEIFTRFHATMWPAMLMSAGLPLPKQIGAHGYWTVGGEKISKSRSEKPPRPEAVLKAIATATGEERAADALRYYELREMTFGQDADFSVEALLRRYNDDLGNDLGNLLHRVLTMIGRYREGVLPDPCPPEAIILEAATGAAQEWEKATDTLHFSDGLKAIWGFLGVANRYVDQQAPWSLAKAGDQAGLDRVLYASAEALRIAAVLIAPVMPNTASDIEKQLGLRTGRAPGTRRRSGASCRRARPSGSRSPCSPSWNPRSLGTPASRGLSAKEKHVTESAKPAPEAKPLVSIKDFMNFDLRVAEILTAEPVPGADKLLKLTVDIGTEQRTLVAGIALAYKPEDLPGKKIVIITNLEPATIRGVKSEGMLLAGSVPGDDTTVALLTPEKPLPNGAKVK